MQRVKLTTVRIPGDGYLATLTLPGQPPQATMRSSRRAAERWAIVRVKDWTATAPARLVLEACGGGMQQAKLAKEFGVNQATISRWKNDAVPMPHVARRLAATLAL